MPLTPEELRAEAEECRATSQRAGEYNAAFWVAAIVLDNLAKRLEAKEGSDGLPRG